MLLSTKEAVSVELHFHQRNLTQVHYLTSGKTTSSGRKYSFNNYGNVEELTKFLTNSSPLLIKTLGSKISFVLKIH